MKLCENDLQFVLNEQITKLSYFTQKNAFYHIQYTSEYVLLTKYIYIFLCIYIYIYIYDSKIFFF